MESAKIPSKWKKYLTELTERLERIKDEFVETKKGKRYCETTLKLLSEFTNAIIEKFTPKPPRTLQDGFSYALSRSWVGTYLALLDDKDHLIKTVLLRKNEILDHIPEFKVIEKEITIPMKARFLTIPELNIEKPIPKSVAKIKPFACNPEEKRIHEYD